MVLFLKKILNTSTSINKIVSLPPPVINQIYFQNIYELFVIKNRSIASVQCRAEIEISQCKQTNKVSVCCKREGESRADAENHADCFYSILHFQ